MKKIMLDPGHVGYYFNRSPLVPDYYESATMWEFSKLLKTELENRDFEVGITRYSIHDDPELTARGRCAKGYDLFLSLHSNAAATKYPSAPWIIHFASDDRTYVDEESRRVASVLGPVISETMGVDAPYYYTSTVDFDRDGDGRIGDEYYGVLFGAKQVGVPGVILEHSFHTNEYAANWLLDYQNLKRLAIAEADALAKYYDMEVPMTTAEKKDFDALKEKVNEHTREYDWTLACPEWAQSTVHKLHQKGVLKGDEHGQLNLTMDALRILVILDRQGIFD